MPSALLSTPTSPTANVKRRGSNAPGVTGANKWRLSHNAATGQFGMAGLSDVFGSDEEEERQAPVSERHGTSAATLYPGVANGDPILWSRWDELWANSAWRRLLFLSYSVGLQIWDYSSLGSVPEILNLSSPDWGHFSSVGVLPAPPPSKVDRRKDL